MRHPGLFVVDFDHVEDVAALKYQLVQRAARVFSELPEEEQLRFLYVQMCTTTELMQMGQHENAMNGIDIECVEMILFSIAIGRYYVLRCIKSYLPYLYRLRQMLIFGVSNAIRKHDHIVWKQRDRKDLAG